MNGAADVPSKMIERLSEVKASYLACPKDGEWRIWLATYLAVIAQELEKAPEARAADVALPLKHLWSALIEQENGGNPALLRSKKKTGRPPSSLLWRQQKAHAILCCEALEREGLIPRSAASEIALIMERNGLRRNGPTTTETVVRWMRDYKNGLASVADSEAIMASAWVSDLCGNKLGSLSISAVRRNIFKILSNPRLRDFIPK